MTSNLNVSYSGGGGYHPTNYARAWTLITATALGLAHIRDEIPDHQFFPLYRPLFRLHSLADRVVIDRNHEAHISHLIERLRPILYELRVSNVRLSSAK